MKFWFAQMSRQPYFSSPGVMYIISCLPHHSTWSILLHIQNYRNHITIINLYPQFLHEIFIIEINFVIIYVYSATTLINVICMRWYYVKRHDIPIFQLLQCLWFLIIPLLGTWNHLPLSLLLTEAHKTTSVSPIRHNVIKTITRTSNFIFKRLIINFHCHI
jgi:hypothetical protein